MENASKNAKAVPRNEGKTKEKLSCHRLLRVKELHRCLLQGPALTWAQTTTA